MQGDEWLALKGEGRWGAGRGERVGPVRQQQTLAARREQRGGSRCTLVLEHVQFTAGRRRRTLVARRESARARAYAMSVGALGCGPCRPSRRRGPCDAAAPPSCRPWRQSAETARAPRMGGGGGGCGPCRPHWRRPPISLGSRIPCGCSCGCMVVLRAPSTGQMETGQR